jgi:TRAP-type C4-dicarboxylate transport system permease small subunit
MSPAPPGAEEHPPLRTAERILTVIVVLVMAGLVLVPISQVVMRGVFTLPFIGAEELTRFLLICLVFLAYPLVVEHGENIVMGELKAAMPRPVRSAINLAISGSGIALCGFFAYVTAANISKNLMNATPTLGIPFVIFLGATLFGFTVATIVHLLHLRKPPQADTNVSV